MNGKVSVVLELSLSVFDQKGATLTVNTGPSPVGGPLVIAADFTGSEVWSGPSWVILSPSIVSLVLRELLGVPVAPSVWKVK